MDSVSYTHLVSHFVKTSVLEAAILQAIQAVSKYVLENEEEFIAQLKACLLYTSFKDSFHKIQLLLC